MTKRKSLVSFLRKEFGLPGKSNHNGRGAWDMCTSQTVTFSDISAAIAALKPKWGKLLVKSETTPSGGITLTFDDEVFDMNYFVFHTDPVMFRQTRYGLEFGVVHFSIGQAFHDEVAAAEADIEDGGIHRIV